MPLFTSKRERRLWLWVLAVTVAIYATLGPARALVDALRARNLLRVAFAVVVLLLVVAFVWQWAKTRPGWSEIGVALGVALAYWLTFLRLENPAERTHLIEYGVVAAIIYEALLERGRNGRPFSRPAASTVGVTALLGLVDEAIQLVLPGRFFDWIDVFFNAFAAFIVIVARLALAPVRRPGWRLWFLWSMAGAIAWGWSMDPSLFGLPRPFVVASALPPLNVPHYLNVAAGGSVVAVLQWVLLRRYVAGALRWVLASLTAVLFSTVLFFGVELFDADLGWWIAGVGLYGTLGGVLQWLVLRQWVTQAGWWVPATTVGWLAALPIGDLNGPPGWAVYGAITGTVLVWLLRQSPIDG